MSDTILKKNKNKELTIRHEKPMIVQANPLPLIGIIMGSDSDLPIMREAADILKDFEIPFEVKIVSAHRTPDELFNYAQTAETRGIKVIISGAGGSAHLPGMVASMTPIPVIGVPIKNPTNSLNGIDSLFSIVQMPPGIPVATVAINGAKNAGILACSILSTSKPSLLTKIIQYKEKIRAEVKSKDEKLQQLGLDKYLSEHIRAQTKNNEYKL